MQDHSTPPLVFVDTGTLLTLMLGGDRNQKGNGYAELLPLLVEKGLVRLAITDMVAAEFLGMQAPVYEHDLRGASPRVTAAGVYNEFRFAEQRIALLRRLMDTGHFNIYRTHCGDEYLQRVQQLIQTSPDLLGEDTRSLAPHVPDAIERIRVQLMDTGGPLAGAVRNDRFTDAHGAPETAGFNDRGEISIGDAIKHVQSIEGRDQQVFVLYEGRDVRGRIIQRLATNDVHDPQYHQFNAVDKRYNPNRQSFDHEAAASLGNIRFVTTKAFLGSMMWVGQAMDDVVQRRGAQHQRRFYVVDPHELENREAFDTAYHDVLAHVIDNGLSRRYNRCRDVAIGHRDFEDKSSQGSPDVYLGHVPPEADSWQGFIAACFEGGQRAALESALREFASYRGTEQQRMVEANAQDLLAQVARMTPESAKAFLRDYIGQLKTTQQQLKRSWGKD